MTPEEMEQELGEMTHADVAVLKQRVLKEYNLLTVRHREKQEEMDRLAVVSLIVPVFKARYHRVRTEWEAMCPELARLASALHWLSTHEVVGWAPGEQQAA